MIVSFVDRRVQKTMTRWDIFSSSLRTMDKMLNNSLFILLSVLNKQQNESKRKIVFVFCFSTGPETIAVSESCLQYISKGKQSHVLCRHMIVTADVIFLRVTAVIKMALRPGSGGGSRYFTPLK